MKLVHRSLGQGDGLGVMPAAQNGVADHACSALGHVRASVLSDQGGDIGAGHETARSAVPTLTACSGYVRGFVPARVVDFAEVLTGFAIRCASEVSARAVRPGDGLQQPFLWILTLIDWVEHRLPASWEFGEVDEGILLKDVLSLAAAAVALLVSFVSLAWTISRDIRRPRFRVTLQEARLAYPGQGLSEPYISLAALNLGPQPNRAVSVHLVKPWWRRWILRDPWPYGTVFPDEAHPATTPFAVRSKLIEVGEQVNLAFPHGPDSFAASSVYSRIGVMDAFGRAYYAPKSQLKKLRKSLTAMKGD